MSIDVYLDIMSFLNLVETCMCLFSIITRKTKLIFLSFAIFTQVARCGNAVPPPFAEALVRANLPELCCHKKITTMKELGDVFNET